VSADHVATRVETIVVGGGQAGLAASYFLTKHGREHLVLERGRVGETWRSQRWNAFVLNTPNWAQRLPGFEYRGTDPDAFAPLAEVIEHLETYARSFEAPVREQVNVKALRAGDGHYVVETTAELLLVDNVIVATGAFQQPTPPPVGAVKASGVFQLTTSGYRRPEQLPDGAVLVVGRPVGMPDRRRVAECRPGGLPRCRPVSLVPATVSGVRDRRLGDRHRAHGSDSRHASVTCGRLACNPPVSGNDGGHDCHPRWLAKRGAVLVGRVSGIDGSTIGFEPGIEQNLAAGDQFVSDLQLRIDAFIAAEGVVVPDAEPADPVPEIADTPELDLRRAGITTILWATGFRPDYSWIELPFTDEWGGRSRPGV